MKKFSFKKKALILLAVVTLVISAVTFFCDQAKNSAETQLTEYHEIIGLFKDGRVTEYTLNLNNSKLSYSIDGSETVHTYTVPDNDLFIADSREAIKSYSELIGQEYVVKADYISDSSALQLIMIAPSIIFFISFVSISMMLL